MSEVLKYLDSKNINYKLQGNEAIIVCPECRKDKLYIHIHSGVYHCFVCEAERPDGFFAKGHISNLKEYFGDIIKIGKVSKRAGVDEEKEPNFTNMVDRYHYNLINTPEGKKGLKYLYSRRINDISINRFKLGFTRRYNQDWLCIPSFEDDIPKLLKFRKLMPDENPDVEKYIREKGSKSILFNGDMLKECDEVIIQEGEIDCITLIQNGRENCIGVTGGAGTLLPEWYDKLYTKSKIYLCFDSDSPGQKAARDVWSERLGKDKCYNINLPEGYDGNKFFIDYSIDDFENLLEEAYRFEVEGIISLKEAIREMYRIANEEDGHDDIFETPWSKVNKLLGGGLKRKRLYVIAGNSGVGKTTLTVQMLNYIANEYSIPGLYFCLEMPEVSLAAKIIQLNKDLDIDSVRYGEALTYLQELAHLPIYFGYSSKVTPEIFYETMKAAKNRYGIQFGVFDNLHRMIRTGEEKDFAKASGMFKDITMDLNIPFILVCQPRKTYGDRDLIFDDIRGARAISDDADHILLLNRKREEVTDGENVFNDEARLTEDKSRFSQTGTVRLKLVGPKSRFEEL